MAATGLKTADGVLPERPSVNIAIFGGSGRVGQALIPALLERGHTIRALQHRSPVHAGCQVIEGSMTDPAAVARVIDGADVVVQMTMRGESIQQAVETSVRGTINDPGRPPFLRQTRPQYILTSSDAATGIWAHPQPGPVSHRPRRPATPATTVSARCSKRRSSASTTATTACRTRSPGSSWVMQEDSILRNFLAG